MSSSSRIIVKNLPKEITKEKLSEEFSKFGQITDIRLVRTKSGLFRRFAFIGYTNETSAEDATKYFHQSYIDSCKINVSLAKTFGDDTIPRPWSKYSKGSSAHKESNPKVEKEMERKKDGGEVKKSSKLSSLLEEYNELKDDIGFNEFASLYGRDKMSTKLWSNDIVESTDSKDIEEKQLVSDMEYLKSKVVQDDKLDQKISETTSALQTEQTQAKEGPLYTLRMRGLPYMAAVSDIHKFFRPIQLANVRLLTDTDGRSTGLAFVDFRDQSDLEEGLKHNHGNMGKRYIELFKDEGQREGSGNKRRPWEGKEIGDELIAETGRLFIRNLPYTTTEEELTELFERFGEITELSLLVNRQTNNSIGLAYVTFMFPEHAVRAFTELDGQIFQGRLLHILPSEPPRKESPVTVGDAGGVAGSSFKKERKEKLKSQSESSHNWNTLFLGSNAVVDAMADSYDIEKSDILDMDTNQSLAVRLALGETQLVQDTKEFLEEQGVKLEVFDEKEVTKRSKTVILVKNLPFGTTTDELTNLFSEFGSLLRVILPPAGISGLIEFSSTAGAKKAFKKLAYSQFKHLPLYLEWAPFGVIRDKNESETVRNGNESGKEDGNETGTTLFVKNLNFSTTDEDLLEFFKSKTAKVLSATVARKHNPKNPTHPLSMGYGFVTLADKMAANKAIKELQNGELDGHQLELSLSRSSGDRETSVSGKRRKRKDEEVVKTGKILVRNVPFEASKKELQQLFATFGELKNIRMPKKFNSHGEHRGFGFVEYVSKEDALAAFESLCHSTHFYGRRLVLEWAESEESIDMMRKRTARYYEPNEGTERVKKRRKLLAKELLDTLEES